MKRVVFTLLISIVLLFMTACSSNDSGSSDDMDSHFTSNEIAREMSEIESVSEDKEDSSTDDVVEDEDEITKYEDIETDRMIIHQAQLDVNVKNLDKTQLNIEEKVNKYKGYIVESNVYKDGDNHVRGHLTVRIPEKHFQTFLNDAEKEVAEVLERNVTGQDVTEQYVDLESRLTSKQAVEKRLLDFMKDAKKTEDLLKISSDLATVQEEIEKITGKINYLENQTAYSTIHIYMYEKSVNIPGVDSDQLETWEKTKKQLATSLNFILMTGSGLIVFFIGNLPIFLILLFIGIIIYLPIKKRINKN